MTVSLKYFLQFSTSRKYPFVVGSKNHLRQSVEPSLTIVYILLLLSELSSTRQKHVRRKQDIAFLVFL